MGTQIVTYVSETGTTDVPDDLSKTTIAAYVPDGSGGYNMLPGSGSADGHYEIPDVPAGGYLLQIGSSYFWTTATNIETGSQVQGRPNPAPSTAPEEVDFDIALSVPTQFYDPFELLDPNTRAGFVATAPDLPSNTFNQVSYWPNALIDASLGDKAYLSHLKQSGVMVDGPTNNMYEAVVQEEMMPVLSIQMLPGIPTNISGTMVQGPATTFRANFNLSAFAALSPQMVTQGLQSGDLFAGLAAVAPFATGGGFPGGRTTSDPRPVGTLVTFDIQPLSVPPADLDLGDITCRNGFPVDHTTLVFADWRTEALFTPTDPFRQSPAVLNADITMNLLTVPTASQPLSPLIGPVTALSLDGADVFNLRLSGISTTPTVTWKAPVIGTANFCQIDVIQLTAFPCQSRYYSSCTVAANVATFQTQQTSLAVPPGVLLPGSMYVLTVTAKNAVAANLDSAPLRTTYPFAYADALSQVFTTGGTPSAAVAHTQRSYGPLVRSRKDLSPRRY